MTVASLTIGLCFSNCAQYMKVSDIMKKKKKIEMVETKGGTTSRSRTDEGLFQFCLLQETHYKTVLLLGQTKPGRKRLTSRFVGGVIQRRLQWEEFMRWRKGIATTGCAAYVLAACNLSQVKRNCTLYQDFNTNNDDNYNYRRARASAAAAEANQASRQVRQIIVIEF